MSPVRGGGFNVYLNRLENIEQRRTFLLSEDPLIGTAKQF